MDKKFIQEEDVNKIYHFCRNKLSSYKLIYAKEKFLYSLVCISGTVAFLVILATIIINFFFDSKIEYDSSAKVTLIIAVITLLLWKVMDARVAGQKSSVQENRIKHLEKYLIDQHYTMSHLTILKNRFYEEYLKRKKDSLRILGVFAILLLPIWEKTVDSLIDKSASDNLNLIITKVELIVVILIILIMTIALFFVIEKYVLYLINRDSRICHNIANMMEHIIAFHNNEVSSNIQVKFNKHQQHYRRRYYARNKK